MRIEIIKPAFSPVQITIETQEDLNLFYNLLWMADDNEHATEAEKTLCVNMLATLEPLTTGNEEPSEQPE